MYCNILTVLIILLLYSFNVQKIFTENKETGLCTKFKLTGMFQILSFLFFSYS